MILIDSVQFIAFTEEHTKVMLNIPSTSIIEKIKTTNTAN